MAVLDGREGMEGGEGGRGGFHGGRLVLAWGKVGFEGLSEEVG